MRRLRGYLWFARRYGLVMLWRYERLRRSGATIDYAAVFTPDQLARLGEHFDPAPWEAA